MMSLGDALYFVFAVAASVAVVVVPLHADVIAFNWKHWQENRRKRAELQRRTECIARIKTMLDDRKS